MAVVVCIISLNLWGTNKQVCDIKPGTIINKKFELKKGHSWPSLTEYKKPTKHIYQAYQPNMSYKDDFSSDISTTTPEHRDGSEDDYSTIKENSSYDSNYDEKVILVSETLLPLFDKKEKN